MKNLFNFLLLAALLTGCPQLGGDDRGLDGDRPGDGGVDARTDMGRPQVCTPENGIVVSIDGDRQAVDPEVLEGYDGADGICVGSTLIGVGECAGEFIDLPDGQGGVCVPRDDPERHQRQFACSDTVFFIERPRWLDGAIPASPLCGGRIDLCLQAFLPLIAKANAYAWFCAPADVDCRADIVAGLPLRAHVESVLPVDDIPGAELPQRAYRVWFKQGDVRLPVRDVTACDLISTLRDIVPEDEALIGRECDGAVHKAAALIEPGDPQAIWHKERMGLPVGAVEPVLVAVVDAGVPRLAFVRSAAELTFAGANPMSPLHLHGIGVTLAILDTAPGADILSMRVMNTNGRGNSADVARGIDRAARESADLRVMNLSIGLAPETRLARVVTGPECETLDDGVGESIAIALEAARARHPELLAFGAPGNRPMTIGAVLQALRNLGRELVEPGASLRFDDPCRGMMTRGWFFPAMLARCSEEAPIVGIGGINDRDQPISVAIPNSEPPLVAPAQHIFLNAGSDASAINRPDEDPICTGHMGTGMPMPELPMVLSGTSLAAAFASGAAAWMIGRDDTLTAREVVRLMYVTGRALCRDSIEGIPVRALHIGRLDTAMSSPGFGDLRDCVGLDKDGWIPDGLLEACEPALDAVGLVDMCEMPERPEPLGWPTDYAPDACMGLETPGPGDAVPLSPCVMECRAEVAERAIGPGLAGKAGPQPEFDPCPHCRASFFYDGLDVIQEMLLEIELSDVYKEGTTFEDPWLIVKDTASPSVDTYVINLNDYTSASDWTPGALIKITGISPSKFPGGEDIANWKTNLVPSVQMNVVGVGDDKTPVQRTSALTVDFFAQ